MNAVDMTNPATPDTNNKRREFMRASGAVLSGATLMALVPSGVRSAA